MVVVGFALVTACSKREQPSEARVTSSATVTSATVVSEIAVAAPASEGMSIEQRFASESANRPSDPTTLRAERALEEFSSLGATMREARQHLGAPFGAKYCVGARTGEDIHLSVCEYDGDERAAEGARGSRTAFAHVENRRVERNGATTLTLRLGRSTPADQALARKLVDAFATMKTSR